MLSHSLAAFQLLVGIYKQSGKPDQLASVKLIWIYTVFKAGYIQVKYGKG